MTTKDIDMTPHDSYRFLAYFFGMLCVAYFFLPSQIPHTTSYSAVLFGCSFLFLGIPIRIAERNGGFKNKRVSKLLLGYSLAVFLLLLVSCFLIGIYKGSTWECMFFLLLPLGLAAVCAGNFTAYMVVDEIGTKITALFSENREPSDKERQE